MKQQLEDYAGPLVRLKNLVRQVEDDAVQGRHYAAFLACQKAVAEAEHLKLILRESIA